MAANESTRERIEKMSIILDHVNYVYGADTPLAVHALNDVCLKIPDGQFIGIIGHTGSGKSVLPTDISILTEKISTTRIMI